MMLAYSQTVGKMFTRNFLLYVVYTFFKNSLALCFNIIYLIFSEIMGTTFAEILLMKLGPFYSSPKSSNMYFNFHILFSRNKQLYIFTV